MNRRAALEVEELPDGSARITVTKIDGSRVRYHLAAGKLSTTSATTLLELAEKLGVQVPAGAAPAPGA